LSFSGDVERMDEMRALFERFQTASTFADGRKTLPVLKRALLRLGVITSDAMARGSRALSPAEAESFDVRFETLREDFAAGLPPRWRSEPEAADAP